MKPITLHPASVLAGLGLAITFALVSGAAQSAGSSRPVPEKQQILGHIPGSWWTSVSLYAPTSYVVPADRYLVVTWAPYYSSLRVDGNPVSLGAVQDGVFYGQGFPNRETGTRIALPPGATLTTDNTLELWGYLEPVP